MLGKLIDAVIREAVGAAGAVVRAPQTIVDAVIDETSEPPKDARVR